MRDADDTDCAVAGMLYPDDNRGMLRALLTIFCGPAAPAKGVGDTKKEAKEDAECSTHT